ncbi:outer membrane channel protein TolC [Aestuariibacter salexigens]|uniref:outer membrane channel protein TolC n=1 Tax=Aestuariibacter salexigens TaxID=226010 RepID=UPI0003FA03B7|nr:outer membrane channel protein TolC [Aestuariibacter salexigens]
MKKTLLALLVALGSSTSALGADLLQIYQEAQQNDPTTLQAKARRDAAVSAVDISRANLLPQISLSMSYGLTRGDADFDDEGATLSLRQSIWSAANWSGYDRAELVANQADAAYGQAKQNLILRVTQAYFDVLRAKDDLEFAQAEKRAIERQLEQTKQRFEVGLTAITGVHEAQAQYDTAVANEIAAFNAVEISKEALREITGNYYSDIEKLDTSRFSTASPSPTDINEWQRMAEEQNLQVLVANIAVDIAKEDIDIATSGHYPTFDLSGRLNTGKRTINNIEAGDPRAFLNGIRENTQFIGVEMSLPLYQGGRVSNNAEAARFDFVNASEDRERLRRQATRNVRSNYYDVTANISSIKAFEQAVVSAESALRATEAGFEVGTRTIVDVLQSTRNLFDARRNLSRARYNYVINMMSLKQAAGTLAESDVVAINQGLAAAQ